MYSKQYPERLFREAGSIQVYNKSARSASIIAVKLISSVGRFVRSNKIDTCYMMFYCIE